jgi:hypothetical protein
VFGIEWHQTSGGENTCSAHLKVNQVIIGREIGKSGWMYGTESVTDHDRFVTKVHGRVFSLFYDRLWAMKKKVAIRRKTIPCLKLYRNDVEEILSLLDDYVYEKAISDKTHEYTDLNDLQQERGEIINELFIEGTALGARLELRVSKKGNNSLTVINSDEIFLQLIDSLKTKRRVVLGGLLHLFSLFTLVSYFISYLIFKNRSVFVISLLTTAISGYLLVGWYHGLFSIIYLTPKHQTSSFWKRNNDALWIIVITAVVSSIGTVLVTYFLFKYGIK